MEFDTLLERDMAINIARSTLFTLASSLLFGLMLTTPASAQVELVFGTYATDKPSTVVRKFKPFLDHVASQMSKTLGQDVSIKMKISKEYEESIDDLATGAVDFARFGPASYIAAKDKNPDIQIVAMELSNGNKRFNGVIAVHENSQIESLSDLEGQSFAFGDELSTIGRYLAQSQLISAGIKSEQLQGYAFLGRHDLVGTAVGNGKFAAGALKESTFNQLVSNGEPIRALLYFENVTKPWLASSNLSGDLLDVLRKTIIETTDSEILKSIAKDGFSTGVDEDYDFVRRAMRQSLEF